MKIEAENIEKVAIFNKVEGGVNIDANKAKVTVVIEGNKEKKLDEITFDDFNSVLNEFEANIQSLLLPLSSTINSTFFPYSICETYGKCMFIPEISYSNVCQKSLWEGWLLFLIYLHILKPTISLGNYLIEIDGKELKIDFLYNETNKRFSDLIFELLNSKVFRTKKSDVFIFNNKNGNIKPNILTVERQKKIISDFSTVHSWVEEVIGEHNFGCLHIASLTDNIADSMENDLLKLKEDLKKRIIEVLKNVR